MPLFVKIVLGTSSLAVLMALLPFLTVVVAILWGCSLLLSALYLDQKRLITVIIINIIIVLSLSGLEETLFLLAFFIIPAVVISLGAQQDRDYYQLQRGGVTVAVIAISLLLGGLYFSTGDMGMAQLEQEIAAQVEEIVEYYDDVGLMNIYEEQGISAQELKEALVSFMGAAVRHLPAFYYLQAIMAVFFMLFLASFWCQKRNLNRLIRKPFDQEIMPWQMAWVVILGLALWLWGRDQLSTVYYIGSNILLLTVPIGLYYGLAAVVYKIRQYKQRTRRIMVIVLAVLSLLFTASAIIFFTVIGLFDSLLDYRRLRTKEE
ncbi:MAG: DUF2232 domain-containing protein [Syntrophomonadaceae bacterium]|nr:DUF2232 domain-containing protein [Syntrophomonadaceae bacterium]